MRYQVIQYFKDKSGEVDYDYVEFYIPDDFITPINYELYKAEFADKILNLCKQCNMDSLSHPINKATGEKYCIALFHDRFKPKWKISLLEHPDTIRECPYEYNSLNPFDPANKKYYKWLERGTNKSIERSPL